MGILACVTEGRDHPCSHVPVPAPPPPHAGGAAGQLTPDSPPPAEPLRPLVRGPCSIFSRGSRSQDPEDPGGIFLEGTPKRYQILEFTSTSSSHSADSDPQAPRVLGFCESRNPSWCTGKPRGKDRGVLAHHPATVGSPAHSQPHWDPTHVYILARATPPDPGQGVVQQQVGGELTGDTTSPPPPQEVMATPGCCCLNLFS